MTSSSPSDKSAFPGRAALFAFCSVMAVAPESGGIPQVIDEGVLAVTRGGDVIATEEFRISTTSAGFEVTSTVSYPPRRTRVVIASTLTVGADSLPAAFESRSEHAGARVVAQFGPRRMVFRTESARGESAREYPAGDRTFVVSDSAFAFYAIPPKRVTGQVQLAWPRENRRADFRLSTRDGGTAAIDGRSVHITVVTLSSGSDIRECWFDDDGRLVRVAVPVLGIVAERRWGR